MRTNLVRRLRLLEHLNEGLGSGEAFERKLTLVSGPAGYSKTTLATDWLQGTGRAGKSLNVKGSIPIKATGPAK